MLDLKTALVENPTFVHLNFLNISKLEIPQHLEIQTGD